MLHAFWGFLTGETETLKATLPPPPPQPLHYEKESDARRWYYASRIKSSFGGGGGNQNFALTDCGVKSFLWAVRVWQLSGGLQRDAGYLLAASPAEEGFIRALLEPLPLNRTVILSKILSSSRARAWFARRCVCVCGHGRALSWSIMSFKCD